MSKSYINHKSSRTPSDAVWEFPVNDEIKSFKIRRIYIKDRMVFVDNSGAQPIVCPCTGDLENTSNKLEQALIDANEPDLNERARTRILMFFADEWKKQAEESIASSDDEQGKRKNPQYVQKYYDGFTLFESILIEDKAYFLHIVCGKAKLSEEISLRDYTPLRPWDRWSYLNTAYEFSSEQEINTYIERARKETLDSLYNSGKSLWNKYLDVENFHISICAGDTLFTYFQDKLGMTHYLLFVGDNDVGKTNNLKLFAQVGYRGLFSTSITPANIYRSLGNIEAGQVTILEDEIDNIEEQDEKMRIYKTGYNIAAKVPRSDDTGSGRKSQAFYTYCFKAFTSEKQPDSTKAKGFNDRTFVIKCSAGKPDYDISEVLSPAGDEGFESLLYELADYRKLLLVYRHLHYNDPIPNIDLTITNRDKQLCKPLIRLFQGTEAEQEILHSLSRLLEEKKDRKKNTIEAILYRTVNDLIGKELQKKQNEGQRSLDVDVVELTNDSIWTAFKAEVGGKDSLSKHQSIETVEYDTISKKSISGILKDRFGADRKKFDDGSRGFKFSRAKLEKVGTNYSEFKGIEIKRDSDIAKTKTTYGTYGGYGTSGSSIGHESPFDSPKDVENRAQSIEKSTSQMPVKEPEPSIHVPEVPYVPYTKTVEPTPNSLTAFGFDDPIRGSVQKTNDLAQKSNELEVRRQDRESGDMLSEETWKGRIAEEDSEPEPTDEDYETHIARQKKVFDAALGTATTSNEGGDMV